MTSGIKTFTLWCILFILIMMVLVVTVYLTDCVSKLPDRIENGISVDLQKKLCETQDDNGFPYTVSYDGEKVHITDASGKARYEFSLTPYVLPEGERELLSKGIEIGSMDELWSLIESYTS